MIGHGQSLLAFGASEEALNGHAFRVYTLTNVDGSLKFMFKHNTKKIINIHFKMSTVGPVTTTATVSY